MSTQEIALWLLQSEDNFVIFGGEVCRPAIYEECKYVPVIRVKGKFYHIKVVDKCIVVDYESEVIDGH